MQIDIFIAKRSKSAAITNSFSSCTYVKFAKSLIKLKPWKECSLTLSLPTVEREWNKNYTEKADLAFTSVLHIFQQSTKMWAMYNRMTQENLSLKEDLLHASFPQKHLQNKGFFTNYGISEKFSKYREKLI